MNKLYNLHEVIKILCEESNHYDDCCFENINGIELYRHKGYLMEGENGTGTDVKNLCFDRCLDKIWKRKW